MWLLVKSLLIMSFMNEFRILIDTMYRMYYFEFAHNVIEVKNVNVIFKYTNRIRKKNKKLVQKRYYRVNFLIFGKEKKVIEFVGITGTNIINVVKKGSYNKIKKKDKLLLNHKGGILKQKFIDDKNMIKTGVIMLTTKEEYKIKMENGLVKKQKSLNIEGNQKLSTEIVLFENKDMDIDKLNNSYDKKMEGKYLWKMEKSYNKLIDNNKGILFVHKNGVEDQKVSKNKIDKIIKLQDKTLVYKIKKID